MLQERKKWLDSRIFRILIPILIIVTGLLCMFYPWISNWLFDNRVDSEVSTYEEKFRKNIDPKEEYPVEELWQQAIEYNRTIARSKVTFTDPFVQEVTTQDMEYEDILSVNEKGILCFVKIPKINVFLPVYHGTSTETLKKGAGHLKGSSIPIGGIDTHAVISAHTGINNAKMFSDLTAMEIGDYFFIHVLDKELAYKICDIQVILPEETSGLGVQEGRDLVSLITCTPYGVNSHRLVVVGERTEYLEETTDSASLERTNVESEWMKSYREAMLFGFVIVFALFFVARIIVWISKKGRRA